MNLVDTHVHVSNSDKKTNRVDRDLLLRRMEKYGIDKSIVFCDVDDTDKDNVSDNNRFVLSECKKSNNRLIPYYYFIPAYNHCIIDLKNEKSWRGVKLHPNTSAFFGYGCVYDLAEYLNKEKKPVIIHSDITPGMFGELLNYVRNLDCNIGICHAFHMDYASIKEVAEMKNVYLEISPWIYMNRFPDLFLAPKERRPKWFVENDPIVNLLRLFDEMKGRLIWGSDLSDEHPMSFGMECRLMYSIPIEVYKIMVTNSYAFI